MAKSATPLPEDLEVLAAEYVLGVSSPEDRLAFEQLSKTLIDAADAKLAWENRLHALDDDYAPIVPPASLKAKIDERLFASTATVASSSGWWNALGVWRSLAGLATAIAIFFGVSNADLNNKIEMADSQLSAALDSKTQADETLAAFEQELAARGAQLSELETKLAESSAELGSAQSELASVRTDLEDALNAETPVLVVSLESGETDYRFLAVHEEGSDKVRMTLVSGAVDEGKDFELWLVEPEKQTVSLGVVEAGKTAIELTPEFAKVLEAGGLLAVSLEQKGGSPTGVAQGPVIAVGAPNAL
jgi:anti-sigma-K factor RskA